ncbi:MAG: bifunctional aspartate kinase/homoserine dehydrogenase I [Ignavibacteriaceae bacterium]|nr:bifunctional aspartate kinase/homoserine dehydrogenase I [Ignavibacteriaceae bacterium]
MKILKFGGSSVRDAERIKNVISLVSSDLKNNDIIGIVVSAFQGVTDDLLNISRMAADRNDLYVSEYSRLRERHIKTSAELLGAKNILKAEAHILKILDELEEILKGVYLIRELSAKSLDFILSFGELLSTTIISFAFLENKIENELLDTREIITTDRNFGSARVLFDKTDNNIKNYFKQHKNLQLITGFIASTLQKETTTLGRGGSDYTVSIIGAALEVDSIEIWTDVNGVLTADPKKVRDAFSIANMDYEEAMELSHFGAKVIYPPTMHPAAVKKIPVVIRNTFNPGFEGTKISTHSDSDFPIKGISSIDDITLVRVEGSGMIGVAGIAQRVFSALAKNEINIILITQASSEHSICLAILPVNAHIAKLALEEEFSYELKMGIVNKILLEKEYSVIAVVGKHMRNTVGIAGRFFSALGDNSINISAIAQGSSELNISAVISRKDELKALNVIHHKFFSSGKPEPIHLFLAGYGSVGSELVNLIYSNPDLYHRIRLHGIINTKKMLIGEKEIPIKNLPKEMTEGGQKADLNEFINRIKSINYRNSVFVDCTASDETAEIYNDILNKGINIVAANKRATTKSYAYYSELKEAAVKNNVKFLYETNVAAALPVISTMNDLKRAGDKIIKIEGVLSGTLSFLFNNMSPTKKFSRILKEAKEKGYSEPDVREDLKGTDSARKILVLIREAGYQLELNDIKVENLVPPEYRKIASAEEFLKRLPELDDHFDKILKEALGKECRLRYIASFNNGVAEVGLKEVGKDHPFYNLAGTENVIAYYTDYYNTAPQVINGPGAGTQLTSVGIISDIFKIFG